MTLQHNFQSLSLDDIVFEGRNKTYGAYVLRKLYASNLLKGFLLALSVFVALLVLPLLMEYWLPAPTQQTAINTEKKGPTIIEPPIIEVVTPKPPEAQSSQPIASMKKNLPYELASDDTKINNDPPSQKDLENTVSGPEDLIGEPGANPDFAIIDHGVGMGTGKENNAIPVNEAVDIAEKMPEFFNGNYLEYLQKNIKYPVKAVQSEIQGTVYVSFVVNTDGSVGEVKLLKGIGFGCDEEALRVIAKMPVWNPGMQGGRPVRVRMTVPVKFKLENR